MKKQIHVKDTDHYLMFPIQTEKDKKTVILSSGNHTLTEFSIPIGDEQEHNYPYDFLACIPLRSIIENITDETVLTIEGDVSESFLSAVYVESEAPKRTMPNYHIHFSPEHGWMNDPNGLVYANGMYHLYYQFNPFDTRWDNMSWGHAVSEDLIHWEQRDVTLLPDEDGMVFSGCGIVNEFGLLDLPKDCLLFFYSAAGSSNNISNGKDFTQKIAYSIDGGDTLIKFDRGILPTIEKKNRDPKVFWHQNSKAYIMCLWLKDFEFAILRSIDLEHWEMSQRLELERGFECPDLFELSIDYGEKKWVFWSADGFYYLGDFDGYLFHSDGIRREAYKTKIPYAAQTISNVKDKTISIPWLRTRTYQKKFTGAMGIPRELSLTRRNGEIYLKQKPITSIKFNYEKIASLDKSLENNNGFTINLTESYAFMIDTKTAISKNDIRWHIYGNVIEYNSSFGILKVNEEEISVGYELEDFSIIYDKGILEIYSDNGIIYEVFELAKDDKNENISIYAERLEDVRIYQIT